MAVDDETGARAGVGAPEQARSGDTVEEAVERFETGTRAEGDHTPIGRADTGGSRLEQMVEVEQTGTDGPGSGTGAPDGPGPRDVGSGGAQRIEGARISDRLAGGGTAPDTPSDDAE
jgi:hypothetical protein